MTINVELRD